MSAFALSLSLAKRLYAVTAVIGAALAGLTVFAFAEMGAVIGASERVRDQRSPQLQRVAHMGLAITRSSLQLRHAMLARNPDERDAALQDVGRFRLAFDEALHAYQADAQTSAGQARAAAIATRAATFWQVGGRNIALIQRGDQATAFAFLVDNAIPARNALLKALHEAEDLHRQELERDVRRIGEEARATRNSVATLAGLILALLVAASWHVAKVLRQRVALTKRCADQVREGDFTQTLHDPARDEFSPLLQAMQDMKDSLSRVVGTVRANAESVAMASTQMAQGNLDLSQRTEEQASSLQQTAASMDGLGAIVKRNAVHAQEAKRSAEGASTVAAQGGAVVGQVVTTMAGISDASRRITEIIGTIDGIAFQTNILALNAAVEAARAGEQGRGFAVVAGEVRLLARRSAEAAKEIKLLITQSGERVHHGALLVEQAGQTMADVVASIQRVASLVAEISEGSNEQSAGIDQVGQAIAQMDTVTQQNAALVEESAAASESLRTQASELLGAVDRFKLAGVAGRV